MPATSRFCQRIDGVGKTVARQRSAAHAFLPATFRQERDWRVRGYGIDHHIATGKRNGRPGQTAPHVCTRTVYARECDARHHQRAQREHTEEVGQLRAVRVAQADDDGIIVCFVCLQQARTGLQPIEELDTRSRCVLTAKAPRQCAKRRLIRFGGVGRRCAVHYHEPHAAHHAKDENRSRIWLRLKRSIIGQLRAARTIVELIGHTHTESNVRSVRHTIHGEWWFSALAFFGRQYLTELRLTHLPPRMPMRIMVFGRRQHPLRRCRPARHPTNPSRRLHFR